MRGKSKSESTGSTTTRGAAAEPPKSSNPVVSLQHAVGNRATSRVLAEHRGAIASMEQITGFDLSPVRFHERSRLADGVGVDGVTIGHDVHLASSLASDPAHASHVVRHELAHVIQQATNAGGTRGELELAAERTAAETPGQRSSELRALPAVGAAAAQAYDPRFHRRNTVRALVGTGFSDQQIGQIYAANWERDLSQAHPALGNTILWWKAVKVAAARRDAVAFATASAELRKEMAQLLSLVSAESDPLAAIGDIASAKSYGGYRFYHHFDNPVAPDFVKHPTQPEGISPATAKELSARVSTATEPGLPQHLIDSRQYVKAQLALAVQRYRTDFDNAPAMAIARAFGEREAQLKQQIAARTAYVWGNPVNDDRDPAGTLTSPVTAETAMQAARVRKESGLAEGTSVAGARFTPAVADALGRAGHAVEDFFSHSNFVELALGESTPGMFGLDTGTFETNDSGHALAHKLRGLVDDIDGNRLVLYAALGGGKLPEGAFTIDLASETMPKEPPNWAHGGIPNDVPRIVADMQALTKGRQLSPHEVETAWGQLSSRISKWSEFIEGLTRNRAAPGSHTAIAKDQPGHHPGNRNSDHKTFKFLFAQKLSEAADLLVIGKMPAVLSAPTMQTANTLLEAIFATLDALIRPPTPDHPLWKLVQAGVRVANDVDR